MLVLQNMLVQKMSNSWPPDKCSKCDSISSTVQFLRLPLQLIIWGYQHSHLEVSWVLRKHPPRSFFQKAVSKVYFGWKYRTVYQRIQKALLLKILVNLWSLEKFSCSCWKIIAVYQSTFDCPFEQEIESCLR